MWEENENLPLLDEDTTIDTSNDTSATASNGHSTCKSDISPKLLRKIALLMGIFIVLVDLASFMRIAPKLRIFELSICRAYYQAHDPSVIDPDGNVPEMLCKVDQVQQDLAMLRGWLNVFKGVPRLLVAIPYGILADFNGRKFVVALNLLGQILGDLWIIAVCCFHQYLPIKAVWASGAFRLIGGGTPIKIFFFLGAAMLITEVVAPFSGSLILSHGFLYLPMLLGMPLEFGSFFIIWLLPETLTLKNPLRPIRSEAEPASIQSSRTTDTASDLPLLPHGKLFLNSPPNHLHRSSRIQRHASCPRFVHIHGQQVTTTNPRLISPIGFRTSTLDCCRASIVFLVVGRLMIGFSTSLGGPLTSLIVFTSGSGIRRTIQSYTTSLVPPSQIASLYTLISLVDGIGSITAAALLPSTFVTGIKLGGVMQGLPFFIIAVLYTMSSVGVWVL